MSFTSLNDKKGTVEITYKYTLRVTANVAVNLQGKDVIINKTISTGIKGTINEGIFKSDNYKPKR